MPLTGAARTRRTSSLKPEWGRRRLNLGMSREHLRSELPWRLHRLWPRRCSWEPWLGPPSLEMTVALYRTDRHVVGGLKDPPAVGGHHERAHGTQQPLRRGWAPVHSGTQARR